MVDGVGTGYAYDAQGAVGFETCVQGDTLGFFPFQVDEDDRPVPDSVIELILTRRAGAGGERRAASACPERHHPRPRKRARRRRPRTAPLPRRPRR